MDEAQKALVTISGLHGAEQGGEPIQFATEGKFSRRGQAFKIAPAIDYLTFCGHGHNGS